MPRFFLLTALLVAIAAPVQAQEEAAVATAVERAPGSELAQAVDPMPGDGPEGETAIESGEVALDEGAGVHGEATVGEHGEGHEGGGDHGPAPPTWLVIPFVVLLLMIATGPLFYPHFWHHHYPKVAIGLGALVAAFYFAFLRGDGQLVPTPVLHAAEEYFSFIALLGALFVASGTILIKTDFPGTPKNNSLLLFAGAVLSNFIGTTGASMLLIRPFMRLNAGRLQPYHIIFFIFIVSNVGGALTPIGDPPLFLGFLRGVPFFWTVTHIWYIWLPTILMILGVFWVFDARNKAESVREVAEEAGRDVEPGALPGTPVVPEAQGIRDVSAIHGDELEIDLSRGGTNPKQLEIEGKMGFVWLAVVIASVFLDPNIFGWVPDLHEIAHVPFGIREVIMFGVCVLAFKTANPDALRGNDFNFEPIKEVGYLFIGIFLTMQPALTLIGEFAAKNADSLGVTTFYFGTGILSGVLDNAPTYVSFLSAAMGKFGSDINVPSMVSDFANGTTLPAETFYLQAISVAAVFFGALTYIGNGPNFMVKAIAESSGAQTPSFVAYIVKYSLPILIPIYILVWFVFFSGYLLPHPADAAHHTQMLIENPQLLTFLLP